MSLVCSKDLMKYCFYWLLFILGNIFYVVGMIFKLFRNLYIYFRDEEVEFFKLLGDINYIKVNKNYIYIYM